ncbi:MAG: transposase [Bradyrhizobium sp.]|nr:transposase [Bradyrhizobium sp.]
MIEAVSALEGAPVSGRRRWSASFKADLVAKALEPGVNVSAIARSAGVHPAQLFAWKRQALRHGAVRPRDEAGPRFVEVETRGSDLVEVVIGAIVVRARADIGEEHLRRVIRAVRTA